MIPFLSFNPAKFLEGFFLWRGDKLGKLLFMLLVIAACLFVFWKLFVAPSTIDNSSQEAETITNITQIESKEDSFFLGLKVGSLKLGLRA